MGLEPELSVSLLIDRLMEMPFLSGFTTTRPESNSSRDSEHPDHESTNSLHHQGSSLDRIILISPVTQGIVVIGGGTTIGFESLMNDLMRKDGQPPAP
ncbi:E3 ubiquitin-protein ligase MPSR1 [Lactuca sativa]|uniref:E3 ubiquitin-protein ligase MPSR1 n=1 Tax=Lactuca sativa TaxID=4236 RepID=UPI000CB7A640|nr:E3 ubiquitin-protein ligase MPSR1 [Lactuca sativa]